jgi:hypothetical protein
MSLQMADIVEKVRFRKRTNFFRRADAAVRELRGDHVINPLSNVQASQALYKASD